MIAASTFARQSSVWRQVAPTLEQVVRWCNQHEQWMGTPVRGHVPAARNALTSETAFLLVKSGYLTSSTGRWTIAEDARRYVRDLPRGEYAADRLNILEWQEVFEICRNIELYTSSLSEPEFSAPIPGCGVVDKTNADVRTDDEIVEIKAVSRPFRSMDLRQALTYATLSYASERPVRSVTLLNPRRGRSITLDLEFAAAGAGAMSYIELMQQVIQWMIGLQVSA